VSAPLDFESVGGAGDRQDAAVVRHVARTARED
jgi:hypothetical protein